jgi:YaiO family outer membrane protein
MPPISVRARGVAALLCAVLALACTVVAAAGPAGFDRRFLEARELALSGQREAAIAAYSELLAVSPGNADVLLGRGRVYAWMGNWTAAEADLTAATAAAPTYADAWSALGDMYLWSDRPQRAAEAYTRWSALAADDPAPWLARGRAQRKAGSLAAARADFEAASQRGADPAQVKDYLASLEPQTAEAGAKPPEALPSGRYLWSASLGVDYTEFPSGGFHWIDTVASVRRQFDAGSLGFEALTADRFRSFDSAWALDAYADLWRRAYVNLRFQAGTDAVLFPRTRWRAELFQGVGHGWELSASYDRLDYQTPVELIGAGIGRYVGNWYVRWRHLYVPSTAGSPSWSNSDRVTVRDYFAGDADNYVEVAAGLGRTDEPTGFFLGRGAARHSWSASAALVKFLTPRVGFKVGLDGGYGYEGEPHGNDGAFATLYYRW